MKKILLLVLIGTATIFSQEFKEELLVHQNDTLPYRILLPKNYNSQKSYPLLIFLHGAGERGNDNKSQLVHGSFLFKSKDFRENYPAIVVFPQCPLKSYWASVKRKTEVPLNKKYVFRKILGKNRQLEMVELLMETLEKNYMINPNRRYIGGLSMGGMGTFELVARNPDYFAAAFPICGGGNPVWSNLIKTTPLWIFHGEDDDVVLDNFSRKMYEALSKEKASVRLTIYPEVKHSSWDNAFAEADLMHWLFSINVENSLNYK
tara:strand:+ start:1029 stop:1814 length:786 start_codon:yes stop_codon:yes gene_type:complete